MRFYRTSSKGQVQIKQVELMPLHHLHAFFNGTIKFQFGIIPQDKSRHGIRKRLDDARHDKQQGPKKRIDTGEYHRPGHTGVIAKTLE